MTTDELEERTLTAINNLLASVEEFYNQQDVDDMDPHDREAILQGRWIVAFIQHDDEYLQEHAWPRETS